MLKTALTLCFAFLVLSASAAYSDNINDSAGFAPYLYHRYNRMPILDHFSGIADRPLHKIEIKPFIDVSYVLLRDKNDAYLNTIKQSVAANWQPPAIPTTAIVSLTVKTDGTIESSKIFCGSRSDLYDYAALEAVLHTHHLAVPPKDLNSPVLLTITFNSAPRLSKREWGTYIRPYGETDDRLLIAPNPVKTKVK